MPDKTVPADNSQLATRSPTKQGNILKTSYLVAYNFVSALLWANILTRTVRAAIVQGKPEEVFATTGEFAKWSQTAAMLEIAHAGFGIVRAPVFTTFMQVASRFVLVWAIADQFPATVSTSPAYSSMLIAWSVTEVVRYSYFVFNLTGSVPSILSWLRYNMFFVLYPIGISSECWLCWKAVEPAARRNPLLRYVLYFILCLYIPGSYVLYSHMMAQRKRVLRGKQKAK